MLLVSQIGNIYPSINILINNSALLLLEYPSSLKSARDKIDGQSDNYPIISPEAIARETSLMSRNFLPGGSIALAQVSPFIFHLLYKTCIILSSASQERRRGDDFKSLAVIKEALKLLSKRWLAAGKKSSTYPHGNFI